MADFLYRQESYAIRGAAFEVYKENGCGFLESVYQQCFGIQLGLQSIPFAAKPRLKLTYKGHVLTCEFQPDFVCYDRIIVELKAVRELCDEHRAQVHNYLKATAMELGFLINFGHFPGVQIERIVRSAR
ncbi:MAG: GxxExxY protein [Planctomycetaceae bacterium]|nr:GxxExxY protein [Planctomycetaceae bacterium]